MKYATFTLIKMKSKKLEILSDIMKLPSMFKFESAKSKIPFATIISVCVSIESS